MQQEELPEVPPQETTPEVEEKLTPEQQQAYLRKISEAQHKALSQLLSIHIEAFIMEMQKPRVSEKDRMVMRKSLVDAIAGALDHGLDITKTKVPSKGQYAKRVSSIAGILAQIQDNRLLLIADNLKKQEEKNKTNAQKESENGRTNEQTEENHAL